MTRQHFDSLLADKEEVIARIRDLAHKVHANVNQYYDKTLPYAVHLDAVADIVREYAHEVCARPADVVPMIFGAYFHDSIEDARLTYNDVHKIALAFMDAPRALLAAEIVYALTNEKGRNRAERANEKYYAGIRATPYAPLCKFADRMANLGYSLHNTSDRDKAMHYTYAAEMPHFLEAITAEPLPDDQRMRVPHSMQTALLDMVTRRG